MTTTAWPSDLPTEPLRGTLSVTREANRVEFQPDVGSPIRRRRYGSNRILYRCEMTVTLAQVKSLDSFFHEDCGDGSLSFIMTDWVDGTAAEFEWVEEPGFSHHMVEIWRVTLAIARKS